MSQTASLPGTVDSRDDAFESHAFNTAFADVLRLLDDGATVVTVHGQRGTGKSVLLTALSDALAERGWATVHHESPGLGVQPLVRSIERACGRTMQASDRFADAMDAALGASDPAAAHSLDEALAARIAGALAQRDLSAPLVLLIDNAHQLAAQSMLALEACIGVNEGVVLVAASPADLRGTMAAAGALDLAALEPPSVEVGMLHSAEVEAFVAQRAALAVRDRGPALALPFAPEAFEIIADLGRGYAGEVTRLAMGALAIAAGEESPEVSAVEVELMSDPDFTLPRAAYSSPLPSSSKAASSASMQDRLAAASVVGAGAAAVTAVTAAAETRPAVEEMLRDDIAPDVAETPASEASLTAAAVEPDLFGLQDLQQDAPIDDATRTWQPLREGGLETSDDDDAAVGLTDFASSTTSDTSTATDPAGTSTAERLLEIDSPEPVNSPEPVDSLSGLVGHRESELDLGLGEPLPFPEEPEPIAAYDRESSIAELADEDPLEATQTFRPSDLLDDPAPAQGDIQASLDETRVMPAFPEAAAGEGWGERADQIDADGPAADGFEDEGDEFPAERERKGGLGALAKLGAVAAALLVVLGVAWFALAPMFATPDRVAAPKPADAGGNVGTVARPTASEPSEPADTATAVADASATAQAEAARETALAERERLAAAAAEQRGTVEARAQELADSAAREQVIRDEIAALKAARDGSTDGTRADGTVVSEAETAQVAQQEAERELAAARERLAADAEASRERERLAVETAAREERERVGAQAAAQKERERLAAEAAAEQERERAAASAAQATAQAERERLAEAAVADDATRASEEGAAGDRAVGVLTDPFSDDDDDDDDDDAAVEPGADAPAQAASQRYTVVSGDNLSRIAARFDTTVEALVTLNQLENPNRLDVGQVLLTGSAAGGEPPSLGPVETEAPRVEAPEVGASTGDTVVDTVSGRATAADAARGLAAVETAVPSRSTGASDAGASAAAAPAASQGVASGSAPSDPQLAEMAAAGDLAGVRRRLLAGASPDSQSASGGNVTALMLAARAGKTAVAEALVGAGANVGARSSRGWDALMYAAIGGHAPATRALLRAGASPSRPGDNGRTPLGAAVWNGHASAARVLLEAGADVNRGTPGSTPLLDAASANDAAMVALLLDFNPDRTARDADGRTAGQIASAQDYPEIELLLGGR